MPPAPAGATRGPPRPGPLSQRSCSVRHPGPRWNLVEPGQSLTVRPTTAEAEHPDDVYVALKVLLPLPGWNTQVFDPLTVPAEPSRINLRPTCCHRTTVPCLDGPPLTPTYRAPRRPSLVLILAVETTLTVTAGLVAVEVLARKVVVALTVSVADHVPSFPAVTESIRLSGWPARLT